MGNFQPRIALINATKNYWEYLEPPVGILSIASYLLQNRIISKKNLIILDSTFRDPLGFLKYFNPNLIGISAHTTAYPHALALSKKIKDVFNIPIVIGGVHISVCHNQMKHPFDIGVVGEGEETFSEIIEIFSKKGNLKSDNLQKIKGLILKKKSGELKFTGDRTPIMPLDRIPSLDWSLLPEAYFRYEMLRIDGEWRVLKQAPIFCARGCPFSCVFCGRHSVFRGVRFFSIKHSVDEIENLVKTYHIEAIHIYDDTFVFDKDRIRDFIKELKRRHLLGKVVFPKIFGRTDIIDEEYLKLLKEMRVVSILYGFESGSDRILSFLKDNSVKVSDNKRIAELTDKYGIGIIGAFMFGSPNETKKDMEKTLDFIRWLANKDNFIRLYVSRTTPFPGTKLWHYALTRGVVSENIDWNLFEISSPKEEAPPLFFDEKVSVEDFNKIWSEARKLRTLVSQKKMKQKGTHQAIKIFERKSSILRAQIPLQIIRRELGNGRIRSGAKWFSDKLYQHLHSFKNIQEDFIKIKTLLSYYIV